MKYRDGWNVSYSISTITYDQNHLTTTACHLKFDKLDFNRLLQVVEKIIESLTWHSVKRVTHEEGELVSVLADHGDPHRPRPVVVEVGQLVGQRLDVLRLQS